jgi:hypothetical protein
MRCQRVLNASLMLVHAGKELFIAGYLCRRLVIIESAHAACNADVCQNQLRLITRSQ